jgi:hypothetical protein
MTDSTWPIDDSWDFAQDDTLEGFVRRWVQERTKALVAPEMVRLTTRYFPTEISNAMEYIHHTAKVEAYDKQGGTYWREPSYSEIYVGTAMAGMHYLRERGIEAPSRLARLESDDAMCTLRRLYMFCQDGVLSPYHQRFDARLPERLVGRARDLADALSVHTSTVVCACFVAGVSRSEDWLLPAGSNRSRWVERAQKSIAKFISSISTNRGLW